METTIPSQSPEPLSAGLGSDKPASPSVIGEVNDETELTKLDPNYVPALRLTAMVSSVPLLFGALMAEAVFVPELGIPSGIVGLVVLIACAFWIIRIPTRRYAARGYQISVDRLRVVRGILWHSDTIVPFGRVQHIDVDQGPIERFFNIATLTVHTAGSHNASVQLPGLNHELAKDMREEIRAHIKRESL
ncbi:PH domain-containing protein [Erythrobacter sp. YT30]|uniref:PH domain-containing protein n=1 Tax=Erythrobacter sp. YT30 TaxID=1735012 RepID=UPI0009E9167F|nr:PH domain-containing protein [Erythrobacter sp. YT30]